jgi:integrase
MVYVETVGQQRPARCILVYILPVGKLVGETKANGGKDKMAGKLKVVQLDKLEAGMHGDGDGLYLCVGESGSRSWIFRTTVKGKRCEIGLGSLATTSLAEAREEAATLRASARKGVDVIAERRAKQQAERHAASVPTFEAAAVQVHADLKPSFTSENHAYNWLQSLKTYVFPTLGRKRVDVIESDDVAHVLAPIWKEIPDTAARILRRIAAVFDWCQAKHYRNMIINGITVTKPHPCDKVRAVLPKQKRVESHHEYLPYPELPDFIQKLRTSQSALSVKLGFEFLILTCTRTSDVLGARWEEFDAERRVWTIPANRTKMKKEHKVPLSPRCTEILRMAEHFNDSAIVFPGRIAGKPLSNMAFLMSLRRSGYETLTAHGFRSTFKTWAQEKTKFDYLVIEASMEHAVRGVERHYLRSSFLEERRRLMNAWASFALKTPVAKVAHFRG